MSKENIIFLKIDLKQFILISKYKEMHDFNYFVLLLYLIYCMHVHVCIHWRYLKLDYEMIVI